MNKKEQKVDFDLSLLTLSELTKVYEDIVNFLKSLEEKKIVVEDKGENKND
jgi:hypothetical protein